MPAGWPRYPSRDQVVHYLETYCRHHRLRPAFGQQVLRIDRLGDGWLVRTAGRDLHARNVVIATGATARPMLPTWPGMDDYTGTVLHSSQYRNGEGWRGRPVLVVGFGNSACEQVIDLAEHGAHPHLSVRSPVNVLPRDLAGVPVLRIALALNFLPAPIADQLSRPLLRLVVGDIRRVGLRPLPYGPLTQIDRDHRVPLLDIGTMGLLRSGAAVVHGDIASFTADGVVFTDGTSAQVDAVLLATGYRPALEEFLPQWRAVCDDRGRPLISGGPTALPGLFFCGQHVAATGMLREIGREAERIATSLRAR
jgi:cation diffusion facilitator CzcD-associated flavoprotein CzcO